MATARAQENNRLLENIKCHFDKSTDKMKEEIRHEFRTALDGLGNKVAANTDSIKEIRKSIERIENGEKRRTLSEPFNGNQLYVDDEMKRRFEVARRSLRLWACTWR